MTKIAVLGNTGMLGGMVESVLSRIGRYDVYGLNRADIELHPMSLNAVGKILSIQITQDTEWIINCMGATKPYFNTSDLSIPIYANGLFPHQLAQWAELRGGGKVIHITTDCVFDGKEGCYNELDPHSPPDFYGKSKSMGEPRNCMVLRTSIVGPEFGKNSKHFLSWVKSLDGNEEEVKGFTNHWWNGITTLELAYAISDVIYGNLYEPDLFHLFSSDITKYDMVRVIAHHYNLDIKIKPHEAGVSVDRRLRTVKGLNDVVNPNPFSEMIQELVDWENNEEVIYA